MPQGYSTQADYIAGVSDAAAERRAELHESIRAAFPDYIEERTVEVVLFAHMPVDDLARALIAFPLVLKPLLAVANLAARAVERDLGIRNLNTYRPKLDSNMASAIAGYVKPFLPNYAEIPTLLTIDQVEFMDKEIRKQKGRWEQRITHALNKAATGDERFKKRKFQAQGEAFELDAAYPETGDISLAIDVKRIEARRDIHKRCDEIVNKAAKFKATHPDGRFAAFLYYPFIDEHVNVQNRLKSEHIDAVSFASDSPESIENAARMLLAELRVNRR